MGGPFASFEGGSSHPVTPGAIYRGTVKKIRDDGKLSVAVPRLGNQVIHNCQALRGPETNPFVIDDQVLCVFLNNEQSELYVLGRFNYKPKFRNVGINVHDPQFPVHIAGASGSSQISLQIDRTSAVGSSRASMQFHRTITGAGATTAAGASGGGVFSDEAAVDGFQGDWYVWDNHTQKYLLQHTGGQSTAGGLSGNILNTYFAIKATGKHGNPLGTFNRSLYYYPTYDAKTGGSDGTGNEVNYWYWTGAEAPETGTQGYTWYSMSYGYWGGGWYPTSDDSYDLGWSSYRWDDIYATNSTIQTSDQNFKTDIVDSDLGLDFINALRPVSFKWKKNEEKPGVRTHYGLIGQEVEVVLGDAASDTALWVNSLVEADPGLEFTNPETGAVTDSRPAVEEHYRQGIRYGELIAPLIKAVQEVDDKVEGLGAANVEEALTLAQAAIDYCQSFDAAYLAKQPHFEEREALLDDIVARVEALEG